MNIYWDLDETLLTEQPNGHVRVHNMARQMLGTCLVLGHECHCLTTSLRDRALKLIEAHYPSSFKSVTAREDFTSARNTGYLGSEWYSYKTDHDKQGILIDNDFSSGMYVGTSARLKMDYLGIDVGRCFRYNNFDSKLTRTFEKFIKEIK